MRQDDPISGAHESLAVVIEKVRIADVAFDNVTRSGAVDVMEASITQGQRRLICTPNADHVVLAGRDSEFREIIERADLVVADGMAIVYAARWLGTPLRENVGGRLLLDEFAARAAVRGYRLFLLGGRDGDSARRAAEILVQRYPGLELPATYTPPFAREFDEVETGRMLRAIAAARPDALFVCLGTPKQEKWIARNLSRLDVPVSIGVGAAVDMLAGRLRMPPAWMTRVGLEWLHKLWQEPRRYWRRYLIDDTVFFWWILRQRLASTERPAL